MKIRSGRHSNYVAKTFKRVFTFSTMLMDLNYVVAERKAESLGVNNECIVIICICFYLLDFCAHEW